MSQTYKKLVSGSPDGGLITRQNLNQVLNGAVDLDDSAALVSAGYLEFDNISRPEEDSNFTKEWVPDTDEEVSTGYWRNRWKLAARTMDAAETTSTNSRGMNELRKTRDYLLSLTDFYANSDVTMPDNIKTYRQALRDLPANTADPFNVTWPTNPNGDTWNT